jgi:hypothetical protein
MQHRALAASVRIHHTLSVVSLFILHTVNTSSQELNAALLSSLSLGGQRGEPRLAGLVRLCAWGEGVLDKEGVDFPKLEFVRGEGAGLDSFGDDDQVKDSES